MRGALHGGRLDGAGDLADHRRTAAMIRVTVSCTLVVPAFHRYVRSLKGLVNVVVEGRPRACEQYSCNTSTFPFREECPNHLI
ncbi:MULTISPECIES: hypothetical protein [unclassified Kitasatospora]|uniref:hypothetical protein n=1 Tax=unclassified Kitasatospora TaxID=2633591 RepID=UPI0038091DB7